MALRTAPRRAEKNHPEKSKAFYYIGGHSRTGCRKVFGAARIVAEVILNLKEEGK
jgi:hypothetical protein